MSKEVVDWLNRNRFDLYGLSDSIYNEGYDDGCGIESGDEGALGRFHGDLLELAGKDDTLSLRRKTVAELIRDKKSVIFSFIQDAFEEVQSLGYYTDEDTITLYDEILDLFVDLPDDAVVSVGNVTVECKTVSELIAAKEADVRDIVGAAYDDGIAKSNHTWGVSKDNTIGRAVTQFKNVFQNSVIHPVIKEVEVVNERVDILKEANDFTAKVFKCDPVLEIGPAAVMGCMPDSVNGEVKSFSVPVTPHIEGERDILRAVIRSAYLDGYVSGARGGDASDYDIAENAIDNLFAVMKSRRV